MNLPHTTLKHIAELSSSRIDKEGLENGDYARVTPPPHPCLNYMPNAPRSIWKCEMSHYGLWFDFEDHLHLRTLSGIKGDTRGAHSAPTQQDGLLGVITRESPIFLPCCCNY